MYVSHHGMYQASWYAINAVILQYLRLSDDQLFVEKRVRANNNE